MTAFVTGGGGFLGAALVAATPGPVVSLVRDRETHIALGTIRRPGPGKATVVYGDLSDIGALERVMAEYQVDTVFHLAAQTEVGVGMKDPVGTFETNVRGTWNVLEACRRQHVQRVIVASSDKAYGRSAPPYIEASTPLQPDRPYETSKACAEMIAKTYAASYKMSVAWTRCVNLYGPGCATLSTLIPNTIRRVMRGQPPMVRNGGRMRRDWLYIDDAVEGYLRLADSSYVGPMNFGSGKGWTVMEVVRMILEIMGHEDMAVEDTPDTNGEIADQWCDNSMARAWINWTPQHSLKDGLRKTVAWGEQNYQV